MGYTSLAHSNKNKSRQNPLNQNQVCALLRRALGKLWNGKHKKIRVFLWTKNKQHNQIPIDLKRLLRVNHICFYWVKKTWQSLVCV